MMCTGKYRSLSNEELLRLLWLTGDYLKSPIIMELFSRLSHSGNDDLDELLQNSRTTSDCPVCEAHLEHTVSHDDEHLYFGLKVIE